MEAKKIGLNVQEIKGDLSDLVWNLYESLKQRREIERKKREADVMKTIEKLPPEILEKIKPKTKEPKREGVEK